MRIQHYLVIFCLIFLCITLPIFFNTDLLAKAEQVNTEYSNKLLTATEGAMAVAAENSTQNLYFASEDNRQKAVNVFYETLIKSFNYEYSTYKDLVKYYVPCIFLIDTNGYYVEYSAEYADASGYATFTETITPINKWAKNYSFGGGISGETYQVEYHLDDTINVLFQNAAGESFTYEGMYSDLYKRLSESNTNIPSDLLDILSSPVKFYNEKRDVITNILNDQMIYYINVHDESLNQFNNAQYDFTLPQITGEQWARMIDQPTVVSFLQGVQTPYDTQYLNIYALAGSEIEYAKSYVIDVDASGNKYYHELGCPLYMGTIDSQRFSMNDAAKNGAYPCYECIH